MDKTGQLFILKSVVFHNALAIRRMAMQRNAAPYSYMDGYMKGKLDAIANILHEARLEEEFWQWISEREKAGNKTLKELLFRWALLAQETTESARSTHAAPHIINFREGQQSMIELLIEDADLQEELKKWSEEHEKN